MNKQILHIALPSILSNITVPLLALVDTSIAGHLGAAAYIGAIAIGGMLFNMTYWLFGFLRMGTGGLTAQAHGAGNEELCTQVLLRSLSMAVTISFILIVLQRPVLNIAFHFIDTTEEVRQLSSIYFHILIWGAPAVLSLYGFTGFFLGKQNAKVPMVIAIAQNIVNIAVSATLVFAFHWEIAGVAVGTLVAQYAGVAMAVFVWYKKYWKKDGYIIWREVFNQKELEIFFNINRDIFLRTLCLIAVTTFFTSRGAAQGELTLAANTLLMQLFVMFSYIMDGFAYAGEAIGGKSFGANNANMFRNCTKHLFVWGATLATLFTLLYVALSPPLLHLLTNDALVIERALHYISYPCAIPFISFAAFLFDGLFIGTTSTRYMLLSMGIAAATFFIVLGCFPSTNHTLWAAFLSYLGCRGLIQLALYPKVVKKMGKA